MSDEYDIKLTRQQVEGEIQDSLIGLSQVKRRYPPLYHFFVREMNQGDIKTVESHFGNILPLSFQEYVQRELLESKDKYSTLFYQLSCIQEDSLLLLAKFKNTGIRVLENCSVFD